jgi:hypothetical protein
MPVTKFAKEREVEKSRWKSQDGKVKMEKSRWKSQDGKVKMGAERTKGSSAARSVTKPRCDAE